MIDLLLTGAKGKMGSLVAPSLAEQDDLRLVALVDPTFVAGEAVTLPGNQHVPAFKTIAEALAVTTPEVAVDFTTPTAVFANATQLLSAGVHTVVGTTGLDDDHIDLLRSVAASNRANLLIAPNFAIGALLMMRFAAEAARRFGSAEIIELHGAAKKDAPSGTALRTARLMGEARHDGGPSATAGDAAPTGAPEGSPAARGVEADGVRIHSVRLPGLVAHQEVLFAAQGEVLTIRHDTLSRDAFLPGVLLAVRAAPTLGGTVVGLEHLLA
jgi:4-hydroxy-tetrahydrodipicolinate reductase